MNYFLKRKTTILGAILLVVALTMAGCAGFQFKPGMGVEQKLAISKEAGWQLGFRLMKLGEKEQWEDFEKMKDFLVLRFAGLSEDLGDPEIVIDADYMKVRLFDWINAGLDKFGTDIPLENRRLIQSAQNFFYIDCPEGCEATPEQRVLGQAFADGFLEGIKVATAPPV